MHTQMFTKTLARLSTHIKLHFSLFGHFYHLCMFENLFPTIVYWCRMMCLRLKYVVPFASFDLCVHFYDSRQVLSGLCDATSAVAKLPILNYFKNTFSIYVFSCCWTSGLFTVGQFTQTPIYVNNTRR